LRRPFGSGELGRAVASHGLPGVATDLQGGSDDAAVADAQDGADRCVLDARLGEDGRLPQGALDRIPAGALDDRIPAAFPVITRRARQCAELRHRDDRLAHAKDTMFVIHRLFRPRGASPAIFPNLPSGP
jgi:hypothetical protein